VENPLLKRTEVAFEVEQEKGEGTPRRLDVRRELAAALGAGLELVYVRRVETRTGTATALGQANLYQAPEQAQLLEPRRIQARNAPPEEPKKPEAAEEAARPKEAGEPKREEKPKEAPEKAEKTAKEPEKPERPQRVEPAKKAGKPKKAREEGEAGGGGA